MDNPVAPGDVILGKYRVERVLGKGGMGVVVATRHVDLGQLYAIKFLLPTMLGQRDAHERFLREARAASRLQSEHVARVHDVGRMENGAPYMVMEYLDGCDLKAHISRQGTLPVEEAVAYVLQVCDAIAEAHELGIVHRDLKPANLFLVRRRNGSQSVKVLDFGISKHTGPEDVDLTNTNASFGSPLYMSPEQMARTKTVDSRTDIWAIGVILYELLVGKSPFKAATMTEVVSRVLQEEPAPLRELRPDVPPGVEEVVMRCLRKRREERFSTVGELQAALSPFAVVPSVRAPMVSGTALMNAAVAPVAEVPQASTIPLRAPEPPTVELTTAAWGKTGTAAPPRGRTWRTWALAGTAIASIGGAIALWLWSGSASSQEGSPAASAATPLAIPATPVAQEAPLPTMVPTIEKAPAEGSTTVQPIASVTGSTAEPSNQAKPAATTPNPAPSPTPAPTATQLAPKIAATQTAPTATSASGKSKMGFDD